MRVRTAALVVTLFVVAACGNDKDIATTLQSTPADMLVTGQALYEQSCAECHGVDLRGTDKGPSHLSVVYEPSHHADGAFLVAVIRGARAHHWNFGDMPPIPNLEPDDVAAITAYVRSVQHREGFEPYPP
jgi:mono/diheme cytochrome c family protein